MTDELENRDDLKITIRLATAPDALPLARLRYVFRSSLAQTHENEDEFVQRCRSWMQERLQEDGRWKCWIAEQGHTPVGNIWMQLIEKIPNPIVEAEYHAYITNFYIRDEVRGKGIGSMLLSKVLEWCKAQDVQAVILWPTERSRTLYERNGFSVRTDILGLMIEELDFV